MRLSAAALFVLAVTWLAVGCSDSNRRPGRGTGDGGGRSTDGAPATMDDVGPSEDEAGRPSDGGATDPFAPDASCGARAVETQRVPGSVLLLFDRSGSMARTPSGEEPSSGDPSKWQIAIDSVQSVLGSQPDALRAGLMVFPLGDDQCGVSLGGNVPQVPVAPLQSSRASILSALRGADPDGNVTPIVPALQAGWDHLDGLDARGQRGVVLVTDGQENCEFAEQEATITRAGTERSEQGHLTFVVGLDETNNFLSGLAVEGGTRVSDDCLRQCAPPQCTEDADCPSGVSCFKPVEAYPGLCGCSSDSHCPGPMTCQRIPIPQISGQCEGEAKCCHFNANQDTFETDFENALSEITRRFLDSCVFEVPKDDPANFDPDQVNVGVSFGDGERMVLPRGSNPSVNSWVYTDDSHNSLRIQGPICDRLRMSDATVEIVVGCPTVLI